DPEAGPRVGQEVPHARRVDEVHLDLVPLQPGEARRQRVLPCDGFFVVIRDGGAVVHASEGGCGASGVKEGGNQLGLAGAAVPDYSDVADAPSVVSLHTGNPPRPGWLSRVPLSEDVPDGMRRAGPTCC